MLFRHRHLFQFGMGVCDLAVVALALLASNALRPLTSWENLGFLVGHARFTELLAYTSMAAALWCIVATRHDAYRSRRTERLSSELFTIAEMWLIVVAVSHAAATVFWEN